MTDIKQIGVVAVAAFEWLALCVIVLLILFGLWYGIKVEIGQPKGDGLHISLEIYGANRLFK